MRGNRDLAGRDSHDDGPGRRDVLAASTQLHKAIGALHIFVPAARPPGLETVDSELGTLTSATLTRYRHARTASGRLRITTAALLPPATQARWPDESLGEPSTLPARRSRARFAVHTPLGIPRLTVTLRRATPGTRQARP
jgi:hypothetical protein